MIQFWSLIGFLASLALTVNAYGIYDARKAKALSQKSVVSQTMTMTRRETIRMPSQSPQVPYMVRR
jgi:hypothetical protein